MAAAADELSTPHTSEGDGIQAGPLFGESLSAWVGQCGGPAAAAAPPLGSVPSESLLSVSWALC